jgi:hypothetical protein
MGQRHEGQFFDLVEGARVNKKPASPFEWWKNKEPTVFAKDPYFRGNYKVTPLRVNAIKLNNKTFKLNG